jgi:SAM-dependent methyltransferase
MILLKVTINLYSSVYTSGSFGAKALKIVFGIGNVLVIFSALSIGALANFPDLNSRFFASFCAKMTESDVLNPLRCGLLGQIQGRVLEFGSGPGTNFKCWQNSGITEWVGVDPNVHFNDALTSRIAQNNISFPTSVVWLSGEDVDVDPQSFDAIVATHTLCSVRDVDEVLRQVDRALKEGGTYYIFEHVSAEEGTLMRFTQSLLSPLITIVGKGCQFRELWRYFESDFNSPLARYNITMNKIDAPIGLPPLRPHIIGTATKPHKQG